VEEFRWRPAGFRCVLSHFEAGRLLEAVESGEGRVRVPLDLGRDEGLVSVEGDGVRVRGVWVSREELERMVGWEGAYGLSNEGVFRLEIRAGHYYKLLPVRPGEAPTVEIDGIRMHRTKWTDPWTDAGVKVRYARVGRGDRVLDVCTGLGYTAVRAVERGAEVVSVEKDRCVLELSRANPWSEGLREVRVLVGRAEEVVPELGRCEFDAVVHDPPRLARAGELYSRGFYRALFRVMRPGARLVHYVGAPGSRYRGKDIIRGVARRLVEVGFEVVRVDRRWGLVIAERPSGGGRVRGRRSRRGGR